MASTVHQRFASRLPSFEQEMGEEPFVSGLVGPYRIFQRKNGHPTASMMPLTIVKDINLVAYLDLATEEQARA